MRVSQTLLTVLSIMTTLLNNVLILCTYSHFVFKCFGYLSQWTKLHISDAVCEGWYNEHWVYTRCAI